MCFFNFNKQKKNNYGQYDPLAGKSQREILRIKQDSIIIKRECDEINRELQRTRDKSISDILKRKLNDLQNKCLHVEAKRTHITGMVVEPCPDCGFVDPQSNYAQNIKKTSR